MIRSMTAYANIDQNTPWGRLTWEVRSVNHRYLELSIKLPEEFRALEPRLRERIAARVSRGKLDLFLRFKPDAAANVRELKLNRSYAEQLARLAKELDTVLPGLSHGNKLAALQMPGMIEEPDTDHAGLHGAALAQFESMMDEFIAMREREGTRTKVFMMEKIDGIDAVRAQVREWLPEIRHALRVKLETKLADLKQPLDPGRLEQELVLSLQRFDVDEELDRLSSHVVEARNTLKKGEAVGRRLDFLLQEFNRESNTLGSKSVDSRTTQASVELKVLIEQLREQVQNIE